MVTGFSLFIATMTQMSWTGWSLISLVIALFLALECGRRLHQSLRERRFLSSP